MRLLIIFFFLTLGACGQKSNQAKKHKVDIKALQLGDSAIAITQTFFDSLNYVKAISLLDKATEIDSDYFFGYEYKLVLQVQLKQYDKALATSIQLIRLNPINPDFYQRTGVFYQVLRDSISADKYFKNALTIYDDILDTMKLSNKSYDVLLMGKGIDLVMLGQQHKGNDILKQLYSRQTDTIYREQVLIPFMNKTKNEIINHILNPTTN